VTNDTIGQLLKLLAKLIDLLLMILLLSVLLVYKELCHTSCKIFDLINFKDIFNIYHIYA